MSSTTEGTPEARGIAAADLALAAYRTGEQNLNAGLEHIRLSLEAAFKDNGLVASVDIKVDIVVKEPSSGRTMGRFEKFLNVAVYPERKAKETLEVKKK